ncbi:hypothetical protein ABK040_005469 [Willaertia magna]
MIFKISLLVMVILFFSVLVNAEMWISTSRETSSNVFSSLSDEIKEHYNFLVQQPQPNDQHLKEYLEDYFNINDNKEYVVNFPIGNWRGDWNAYVGGCKEVILPFSKLKSTGNTLTITDAFKINNVKFNRFVKYPLQSDIYFSTITITTNPYEKPVSAPICTKVTFRSGHASLVMDLNILNLCEGAKSGKLSCNSNDARTKEYVSVFTYNGNVTILVIGLIVVFVTGILCLLGTFIACCCTGVCTCGGLFSRCVGGCGIYKKRSSIFKSE